MRIAAVILLVTVLLVGCGNSVTIPDRMDRAGRTPATISDRLTLTVEPRDGVRGFVRDIDRARTRVFLCAYILSDSRIVRALERAADENVSVYVLLDPHPYGMGGEPEIVANSLRAAGVHVRWTSGRFQFTHAKYLVADDRLAVISTANFSRSAFSANREFLLTDQQPAEVRAISNLFRSDWNHRLPPWDPHLVLAPANSRRTLEAVLRAATRQVDVYAEEINDGRTERLLRSLAHRGVRVRVLLPSSGVNGDVRRLAHWGIAIRTLDGPYVHAKAVLADGTEGIIGSQNISLTSLDRNRELSLRVGRKTAAQVDRMFALDWLSARPLA